MSVHTRNWLRQSHPRYHLRPSIELLYHHLSVPVHNGEQRLDLCIYLLHNYLNKIEDITRYRHTFLSVELLYMFRHQYLVNLDSVLDIPVDYHNPKLHYILNKDPNAKYVHYVEHSWLDKRRNDVGHMIDGSRPHIEKETV